jgi:hypothetical protein
MYLPFIDSDVVSGITTTVETGLVHAYRIGFNDALVSILNDTLGIEYTPAERRAILKAISAAEKVRDKHLEKATTE